MRSFWKEMTTFIERLNNMSPEKRRYTLEMLPTHLAESGKTERFRELLTNFEFIEAKILALDSQSLIADYDLLSFDAPVLGRLQRALTQNGHLFDKCEKRSDLAATLYSRLHAIPDLVSLIPRLEATLTPPYLMPRHPLPDLPHPALLRTLTGHTAAVHGCAISGDGRVIVSASFDKTLKVWDAQTGAERFTLSGHTRPVIGCAISKACPDEGRDGPLIVSASLDKTLKVWNGRTGQLIHTLRGHTGRVLGCAISSDGGLIVSASEDETLNVWDGRTGQLIRTLHGHTASSPR